MTKLITQFPNYFLKYNKEPAEIVIDRNSIELTFNQFPVYYIKALQQREKYSAGRLVNKNKIGKTSFVKISGNDLFSGASGKFTKGNIIKFLHEYYVNSIKTAENYKKLKSTNISYPVQIERTIGLPRNYGFFKIVSEKFNMPTNPLKANWDIGNLGLIHCKIGDDALQEVGLLPTDTIDYVSKTGGVEYVPVSSLKQRFIKITITWN